MSMPTDYCRMDGFQHSMKPAKTVAHTAHALISDSLTRCVIRRILVMFTHSHQNHRFGQDMNISDELRKLADLRREGHLTEEEFSAAKRQLLLQGDGGPNPQFDNRNEGLADGLSDTGERVYYSSRWTSGNMFFPDALVLVGDGIVFRKGSLFGSREEHISYKAVASLRITNGILFSTISIETSGGSQPIVVNGLWKTEAKEIQDALREFQRLSHR